MFSKSLLTAFVAGLAAFAQAQDLFDPSSNPTITPATGELVPAGSPYTLTWTPTTSGAVSIELLAGASQSTLTSAGFAAQSIPNSGSFTWTPTNALASSAVVGYKIIDVATGKFQYSVPFKVQAAEKDNTPEPTTKAPTVKPTAAYGDETTTPPAVAYPTHTPIAYPTAPVPPTSAPYTTLKPTHIPQPSGTAPGYNTTIVKPTGSAAVPTNLYPTAPPSEFPGAASAHKAGLGLAGLVAGFVLML